MNSFGISNHIYKPLLKIIILKLSINLIRKSPNIKISSIKVVTSLYNKSKSF